MNRMDRTFARLKTTGEKALIAYIMAGDPSLADTESLVLQLEKAGADIIVRSDCGWAGDSKGC